MNALQIWVCCKITSDCASFIWVKYDSWSFMINKSIRSCVLMSCWYPAWWAIIAVFWFWWYMYPYFSSVVLQFIIIKSRCMFWPAFYFESRQFMIIICIKNQAYFWCWCYFWSNESKVLKIECIASIRLHGYVIIVMTSSECIYLNKFWAIRKNRMRLSIYVCLWS